MSFLPLPIRARLQLKHKRLQALRPFDALRLKRLRTEFEVEMTFNSNAIEGNSLTLRETFLVLEEGMTIKGKPLKDHLEATDHKEALDFLHDLVSRRKTIFSEYVVRQCHQLVMRETEREWAGRYRNGSVRIAGARYVPPDAIDVPKQMHGLIQWYWKHNRSLHPVELAALVHYQFVAIHPFFDGNGRTGRLVMNFILMRAGYPLSVILIQDRKKYYRTLQQADRGDPAALVLFIAQAVERSLDIYLRALDRTNKERWISLADASHGTPYHPKYLNLLARTGRIEAQKRGRNWYTTTEAIQRYRMGRQRQR